MRRPSGRNNNAPNGAERCYHSLSLLEASIKMKSRIRFDLIIIGAFIPTKLKINIVPAIRFQLFLRETGARFGNQTTNDGIAASPQIVRSITYFDNVELHSSVKTMRSDIADSPIVSPCWNFRSPRNSPLRNFIINPIAISYAKIPRDSVAKHRNVLTVDYSITMVIIKNNCWNGACERERLRVHHKLNLPVWEKYHQCWRTSIIFCINAFPK